MENFCRTHYYWAIILCCLGAFAVRAQEQMPAVKIALIGEVGKYPAEVELLTSELSKLEGVVLLERQQLEVILKEHEILLSDASRNGAQLGRLLGADGVLTLEDVEIDESLFLSTRLVAVRTGVIIDTHVFPIGSMPDTVTPAWVETVQWHFAPLLHKLNVSKKDALTVSLLPMRGQTDDTESLMIERQLNSLFSQRLMREKDVFVSERWNLGQVLFEKELEEQRHHEFWTGALLVEGTLELKDNAVDVNLILKNGDGTTQCRFTSNKNDLSGVVEEMSRVVMRELGKHASVTWDIEQESAKYFASAKWAYHCGLYQTARNAADAAWALGNTSHELMLLRIKCYGGAPMAKNSFRKDALHSHFTRWYLDHPEKYIDAFIYALEMYGQLRKENPQVAKSWLYEEANLLRFSSIILDSSHRQRLHKTPGYKEKLRQLQQLTRECFAESIERKSYTADLDHVFKTFCFYAPFWYSSTDELIDAYKQYFLPAYGNGWLLYNVSVGFFRRVNGEAFPATVDWNGSDGEVKWLDFIRSLLVSTDNRERVAGLILRERNDLARETIAIPEDYIADLIRSYRKNKSTIRSSDAINLFIGSRWNTDSDQSVDDTLQLAQSSPADKSLVGDVSDAGLVTDCLPDPLTVSRLFRVRDVLGVNSKYDVFCRDAYLSQDAICLYGTFKDAAGKEIGSFLTFVDLDDLDYKTVVFSPAVIASNRWLYYHEYGRRLIYAIAHNDVIYLVQENGIVSSYDVQRNAVTQILDLKSSVSENAVAGVGNKIYIGCGEVFDGDNRIKPGGMIYEYDLDTKTLNEISSYRRTPPLSPFDQQPYTVWSLSLDVNENLLAYIRSGRKEGLYRCDLSDKKWSLLESSRLWCSKSTYLKTTRYSKDGSWDGELISSGLVSERLRFKNRLANVHPFNVTRHRNYVYAATGKDRNTTAEITHIHRLDPAIGLIDSLPIATDDGASPGYVVFTDQHIFFPVTFSSLSWDEVNQHMDNEGDRDM